MVTVDVGVVVCEVVIVVVCDDVGVVVTVVVIVVVGVVESHLRKSAPGQFVVFSMNNTQKPTSFWHGPALPALQLSQNANSRGSKHRRNG